ncbi:hypothetical protein M426DRAFT_15542 [Hypoxylon sp. CI-4A]|nr:hypothetical protein M426DRAFT_15542 [Hypoxylon sp. CI-4A]
MLFSEDEEPHLRSWVMRRLANTSDADADVLAEYVLALLRHEGDLESVRTMFAEEIPDFLRDNHEAFTEDVFQAIKYRSYIPGAPPAPPSSSRTMPHPPGPTNLPLPPQYPPYSQQLPFPLPPTAPAMPSLGQGGSRKRSYNDRDDNDVDIILTSRNTNTYPTLQPHKHQRRGGGFAQRGGRFDDSYASRDPRGHPNAYPGIADPGRFGQLPMPPFQPGPNQGMQQMDPNALLDSIQRFQQLGIQLPEVPDFPKPVYSGTIPPPRRRKRCRDFDAKGYCARGNKCKFEHVTDSAPMSSIGPAAAAATAAAEEYDPNNAIFTMPLMPNQGQQQPFLPLNLPPFPAAPQVNRREANKSRRTKGRPPFAANGPLNDKSNTSLVVQNIPDEHFSEDKIRDYFSQFGDIKEVSMQGFDRIAIVKFETWNAAHAAWSSPKVIFDNRFVKVFWHKSDAEAGSTPVNGKGVNGVKDGHTNGYAHEDEKAPEESFDLDEFNRKQEEAQKAFDEKTKKRQEYERQRQELEDRQKELRARQLEEKRKLQAKLAEKGASGELGDDTKKANPRTEILRAHLATLEEEANALGIDPDAFEDDSTPWYRGRGRGSRGYRARGGYAPRALRGGYGYQRGGLEARHAAYAAYSLDNRPKIIALSGVDFTDPEKDEPLRQYLVGIGEFKDIHTTPAVTHITFKDRKTAEQFMFGVSANNAIPGLDEKVEAAWATSAPQSEAKTKSDSDVQMASGIEDEQAATKGKTSAEDTVTIGLEEGEVDDANGRDQHDMDFEAGEDW